MVNTALDSILDDYSNFEVSRYGIDDNGKWFVLDDGNSGNNVSAITLDSENGRIKNSTVFILNVYGRDLFSSKISLVDSREKISYLDSNYILSISAISSLLVRLDKLGIRCGLLIGKSLPSYSGSAEAIIIVPKD